MAISTFMGVRPALRGLLAQQQALDVDQPQHRQREHRRVLAPDGGASWPPRPTAMPGVDSRRAGQLGAGVDVAAYQRVRDSVPRHPVPRPAMLQGSAQANRTASARCSSRSTSRRHRPAALLPTYWSAWQNVSNNPEDMATRQALAQSRRASPTGSPASSASSRRCSRRRARTSLHARAGELVSARRSPS